MEEQHYDEFTDDSVKEDDASGRQHGVNLDDNTELRKKSSQTIDSKNLDDFDEEDKERTHANRNQKKSVMEENLKSFQDDGECMKYMRESMQITKKNTLNNFDEKKRNEQDCNTKNVEVESKSMVEDNSHDFNKENKSKDDKHGEHVEDESVKKQNGPSTKDAGESIEGSEESNAKLGETLSQLCASLNLNVESKLTLKHLRTVDNHMFTGDNLTSTDQIPGYILKTLMIADYHVREFTLKPLNSNERGEVSNELNEDIEDTGSDARDSDSESGNEIESVERINPVDALIGIFHCSDIFLRQDLAVKLSACQLSIPFILPHPETPEERIIILHSTLEKIKKSWKGASSEDSAKEVYVTEHPFPVVSFIRVGNVTMSKSSLMNKIISDANGDHEFFFHKNMEGGDVERKFVNGLVELVWYLPGGCDKNTLKNEICFANLRGDAEKFKKQLDILREISNILCILLPSEMPDERTKNFLKEALLCKGKIILIFNEKRRNEAKKFYNGLKNEHSAKLSLFTKSQKSSEFKFLQNMRNAIQRKINETEVKSLVNLGLWPKKNGAYLDDEKDYVDFGKTVETWFPWGNEKAKKLFKLQLHVPALADLERKKHNPSLCRNIKTVTDLTKVKEDLEKEKEAQMESLAKMDENVLNFLKSLAVMNEHELVGSLHQVKYLLDKVSLSVITKLLQQYSQKKGKNYNLQCEEEERLKELEASISHTSFGLEHIFRELAQLYQLKNDVTFDYACAAANILLSGEPLELLDGDSRYLPLDWFDAVYKILERKTNNARIYVISVLGIQSSGKSTMLNTMFGLEFPVSARRCTRGAFASLVPVSEQLKYDSNFDYILIIDTEGLRGLVDPKLREHDNELATFAIGVADVTILNIFGENQNEMKEFLEMAVHAFLKMKLVKEKKSCKIVHQNVAATDAEKMDRRNLKQDLDKMAKLAAAQENCEDQLQKLDDIIAFDEKEDVFYIPSLLKGSPPMAPINPDYGKALQNVKEKIVKEMCSKRMVNFTLSSFCNRVKSLREAMLKENLIFHLRNAIETRAYAALDKKFFEKSVEVMINGIAETEQSIHRKFKRCSTQKELENCWVICRVDIVNKANELETKMEEAIREFFKNSEDRSTLEQWKKDVLVKIKRYKRDREISLLASCQDIFNYLQQRQHITEKQQMYEKQLLNEAKNFVIGQNIKNEEEFKEMFKKEWQKWINTIPPCKEVKQKVDEHMVTVLLQENSELKDDMESKLSSVNSKLSTFLDQDFAIDETMLSFSISAKIVNVVDHNKGKAVFHATKIKDKAITSGQQFAEKISINSDRYSKNDLVLMYYEITSVIKKETEKDSIKFEKSLICDILLHSFAQALPIFEEMEERYVKLHDHRSNLEEKLRPTLEIYFINHFKKIDKEVSAATSIVNVLQEPIKSELNEGIAIEVHKKLVSESIFQNKSSFHASVLIELGKKGNFELFVPYFQNPVKFLKEKLKESVEKICLNKKSSLVKTLLKQKGEKLKSDILSAIDVTNKHVKDKLKQEKREWNITKWIERFVKECSSLAITKEMFGVATMDEDLKEPYLFDMKVPELVSNFIQSLVDVELDSETIINWQPPLYERLFTSIFGCQALCPFCQVLCDQTNDHSKPSDNYHNLTTLPKHSTKLHRPLGLIGFHNKKTKILSHETCPNRVAGRLKFTLSDTNNKEYFYKDYQSVNNYYKSWSIPPDRSFETFKYWKWFMVKFSKELAKHYGRTEAHDIPRAWKKVTFDEAIEQLKKEYKL
ncbi:interferon-induced very large GTPase 1-like [Xenia sp. Carnegie-2017]|uniref:interferon-induced very large GTPase 1-like n=1 Tax=Xenia sp. Carnegie-2017 TaxID=2897299 RepID=UPI001F04B8F2|nr:interferon-induced very large GTPase 1-like [Xenia sp. Carnegie-2017]